MKEFHGKTAVWLAAFALALAATGGAWGQGARPMAMGGAFVGLADDVSAAHHNPAGLVQLQAGGAALTQNVTDRDEFNSSDLVIASPIGTKAAAALSWTRMEFVDPFSFPHEYAEEDWVVSFAAKTGPRSSVGVNVRHISNSDRIASLDVGFDLGFLWRAKAKWSYGLLIWNVNRPGIRSEGELWGRYPRIWTPGVAYRPDKTSVITADLFNASNEFGARALNMGYEKQLKGGWAVRCGVFQIGESNRQAFTLGCGKDIGGPKSKTSLDVAALMGDSDDQVLVSVSQKF